MNDCKQQMKTRLTPIAEVFLGKGGLERKPLLRPVQPRPIAQMMKDLRALEESVWAEYAFSRDPLKGRFTPEQKKRWDKLANECGREYAKKMQQKYGTRDPHELAKRMGVTVEKPDMPKDLGRVLFAEFKVPNHVYLYMDAVHKAHATLSRPGMQKVMTSALDVERLLLAHELFHYVEEQYKREIFTKTEKIDLPTIPPFKNRSTVRSLDELAGMAFARELNNLPYSPYLLDVMLMYGYSQDGAIRLYEEIMTMAGVPIPEPEEEAYSAPLSIYDV